MQAMCWMHQCSRRGMPAGRASDVLNDLHCPKRSDATQLLSVLWLHCCQVTQGLPGAHTWSWLLCLLAPPSAATLRLCYALARPQGCVALSTTTHCTSLQAGHGRQALLGPDTRVSVSVLITTALHTQLLHTATAVTGVPWDVSGGCCNHQHELG